MELLVGSDVNFRGFLVLIKESAENYTYKKEKMFCNGGNI